MGRQKTRPRRTRPPQSSTHSSRLPGIRIRDARPGEGDAFITLTELAFAGTMDDPTQYTDRDDIRVAIDTGRPPAGPGGFGRITFLVAEDTATADMVGVFHSMPPISTISQMARAGLPVPLLRVATRAHVKLKALVVLPDYRHRGIGEHLLATALRLHEEAGAIHAHGHIDADNIVLASWYQRIGFTVLPPKGELELMMGPLSSATLVPEPGEQLITKALG
ncbi:GNAT family N-acetyltransferase [Streptomyces roseus]|uniref:GNAT family N-acetyltransferase n=1 Tax=Streptomyces roseus TaxID=66430 RepID=UPI003408E737